MLSWNYSPPNTSEAFSFFIAMIFNIYCEGEC